jgi:hypothetical protein
MGGGFSNFDEKSLVAFVSNQFKDALSQKKRDYLVLREIIYFELPSDFNFQFTHLGNIFCMDQNKDGRFTLEDI